MTGMEGKVNGLCGLNLAPLMVSMRITRLRHDPRIGVGGGADHFYAACHSVGRSAMEKSWEVKYNAIQVVCSSSYFLSGYIAHKDACLPQIWPRKGDPPNLALAKDDSTAKKILKGISSDQYLMFQKNVLELRRTSVRVPLPASMNPDHRFNISLTVIHAAPMALR
ncbi:hypothetical protein OIU84_027552 [Salix udensis]|uniref:Uncharacterized protein n=1 Tax=Salix udensis TaxID=889485 RepID=A0AAD6PAR7_9ROSI|nr:hypothetical protein OIU84_027552 [Salix udensis]